MFAVGKLLLTLCVCTHWYIHANMADACIPAGCCFFFRAETWEGGGEAMSKAIEEKVDRQVGQRLLLPSSFYLLLVVCQTPGQQSYPFLVKKSFPSNLQVKIKQPWSIHQLFNQLCNLSWKSVLKNGNTPAKIFFFLFGRSFTIVFSFFNWKKKIANGKDTQNRKTLKTNIERQGVCVYRKYIYTRRNANRQLG